MICKIKANFTKRGKDRFKKFCENFNGHAFCYCGRNHVTYVADNQLLGYIGCMSRRFILQKPTKNAIDS